MKMHIQVNLLVLAWAIVSVHSDCKGNEEKCTDNKDCCSENCLHIHFPTDPGVCLGKDEGDTCKVSKECYRGQCINNECECLDAGKNCKRDAECCDPAICAGSGQSATKQKCLLPYSSQCESEDECISGKCEGGKCTCHLPKYPCSADKECCEGKCKDGECECVGNFNVCKRGNGNKRVCCNSSGRFEKCKKIVPEGQPACGLCLQHGEPCVKKEECCGFYCNGFNKCECTEHGFRCRTDSECCSHGSCVETDGVKICRIDENRPNEAACKSDRQCLSGRCQQGHCQCLENNARCGVDAQCCHGGCRVTNPRTRVFRCYGI